ncbi:MAG: SDR family oxidoreductase [Phenylobacterium sp.]|uniref:SDR family NAD(P)-dependent oxidoreductase n=1 Tax=Phenylobacterium sp. TaxID=1871053 RepID=UPI0025D36648|nr:SDR family oxidoreductase [Phenylobacterium sp.]MCA6226888.1 SDR family oxidoreductase [Phenylobacterium sp.]MCA6249427.1 SDR family oxidoreductase [Phenylobacterium sp.]MCA6252942.1 SDR family oxidoreductase [Phenylobacterium sp.]MCA6256672.1 SDR family oxidoreductase [Phenylobacterium sp.]MCA6264181.1 SDR family oxidoreductase [Phenylobacterium sp.]
MSASGPHILVTGSTRGIGAAIVEVLSGRGARVVGHGRSTEGNVLGEDLEAAGAGARLWTQALARLDGRIDVLVNNAGVFEAAGVDLPDAEWEAAWARTLQINLRAAADLSRLAVRHFLDRPGGGRIINVASRAAYRGDSPAHWHYAASKAGMVAMTKSIARGFAARGVLAFAVCPGFTLTGMAEDYLASRGGETLLADIPLGRVADPEEVAAAVAFLTLEAPASMTGAILDINGASYVR